MIIIHMGLSNLCKTYHLQDNEGSGRSETEIWFSRGERFPGLATKDQWFLQALVNSEILIFSGRVLISKWTDERNLKPVLL